MKNLPENLPEKRKNREEWCKKIGIWSFVMIRYTNRYEGVEIWAPVLAVKRSWVRFPYSPPWGSKSYRRQNLWLFFFCQISARRLRKTGENGWKFLVGMETNLGLVLSKKNWQKVRNKSKVSILLIPNHILIILANHFWNIYFI